MLKQVRFWIIAAVVLVAAGGVLLVTGQLPFALSGGPGVETAAADTTGAVADAEGEDAEPKEPPVPVELVKVDARGISAYYRAASVIEADRLVELVSRVEGRVRVINVEEGDWAEQGRVLAELENDREAIQLRKAELTLADEARKLDRNRSMLEEELISRQDYDLVESAWKLAEAERDLARIALEETRIRAPFSGRVTDRMVVIGQRIAAGTPAFSLGDFDPLRLRVHLPENIARKVEAGQRVLVAPEALDEPLPAAVERVAPVVDPVTSTVRLTLLLDDDDGRARVGGFAKVRITTDEHHDALAIPKISLVEEGALRSVFVAEADTVRKIEVRTGLYDETHVEILEGLRSGEFVVTSGQGSLRTGSRIEALNGDEAGYVPAEPTADGDTTVAALTDDGREDAE